MSKAGELQIVLEQLLINDADRQPYTADAIAICNNLMESLKKVDSTFRSCFDGLSLSGSYLDRVKLKTPDEFDMQIKLKVPFHLTPIRDKQRAGFVFLHASGSSSHPAVKDGTVDRKSLQDWLRCAFLQVFKDIAGYYINGVMYALNYTLQGVGCAHTIEAKSSTRTISFDFVPVFEFNYSQWDLPTPKVDQNVRETWPWFAVPQQKRPADNRTFMVCAPHWEREMMKRNYNLKNVLRLMKALRDKHKQSMPHLSSYMLKTVILLQLDVRPREFWQQDLATVLLAMWAELVDHFTVRNLPFYLANDCNHFDRLKDSEYEMCKKTAFELFIKLNSICSIRSLFI